MYVQAIGIVYILRDRVERINVQNSATIGGGYALVVLALVVFAHVSVSAVLIVWVAGYAIAAVWNTFGLRELLGVRTPLVAEPGDLRRHIGFAAKSALSANVTFLALRVDVFIVGALLSPEALGLYTLAISTGEVMWQVSRAVIWSSSGRVATLPIAESAALTARIVRSLVAVQLAAGVVLFLAGPWLIAHVYGARFAASGGVLRLLLPGLVFYSADGMLSYFIGVRAGRPGLLLGLESVTLAVCAGLTLAAVPHYGIAGAAVADTVAYVLSFAIKVVFFSRIGSVALDRVLLARPSDVPAFVRVRLPGSATSSSTRVS
jgi:O-antigen/teichoic acid export membrane protein